MDNSNTVDIGKILFSRCLEAGHWPDKIQFTKYLYLLDYCHWRFHGRQATAINWKFFHYGPWSQDASIAMNGVQDHFRVGWRDFREDDEREFYGFDRINEKLSIGMEGMIQSILKAFKDRDVSKVIDFCYERTEPMLAAERGDELDFSTVPVNKEMPAFIDKPATMEMPKATEAGASRRAAYQAKAERLKAKARKWREAMESPAYKEAMDVIAKQKTADLPKIEGKSAFMSKEAIEELRGLKDG
ncbi:hypothetical protein IEN85_02125 [Pelagicoccus sp. NFK12]|uniref:Antitoxin SocA-like Panacea domain-containing protein n=1 Tax=Pelagicoccus enzymogenes TaxID=2773457 RepID=A0A927IFZ2_9BACT|nr:hypothetical protein [Pelagicoccus enzymogenes]MBD5778289.1 hypothetical protein [Pelagicoccus enzymogenes]